MKTYFKEDGGITFYKKDGILFGAPTNLDGSYVESEELSINEFDVRLSKIEIEEIEAHLE